MILAETRERAYTDPAKERRAEMKRQNFEKKNDHINERFRALKQASPEKLKTPLNLSWSNWGFGRERLSDSAKRLQKAGVPFIELHGNHYGPDLGYKVNETSRILSDHGLRVSGVCGMFSADNDLSSNRAALQAGSNGLSKTRNPLHQGDRRLLFAGRAWSSRQTKCLRRR